MTAFVSYGNAQNLNAKPPTEAHFSQSVPDNYNHQYNTFLKLNESYCNNSDTSQPHIPQNSKTEMDLSMMEILQTAH